MMTATKLRTICGHDSRSVEGCIHCEAADQLESQVLRVNKLEGTLREQKATIAALNACVGGPDSTTTENLVRVSRLEADLAAKELRVKTLREALSIAIVGGDYTANERKQFETILAATPGATAFLDNYVANLLEQIADEAPVNGNSLAQTRVLLAAGRLRNIS